MMCVYSQFDVPIDACFGITKNLLLFVLVTFAAWTKLTQNQHVLVLLFCLDGFQPHKRQGQPLVPGEFCMLSLPPWERYKPENMLLYVLMPNKFPAKVQIKFFNYMVCSHTLTPYTLIAYAHKYCAHKQ